MGVEASLMGEEGEGADGQGLHVMTCTFYKYKGFNQRFELTYSILGILLSFIILLDRS
jgi:hypothetical protein